MLHATLILDVDQCLLKSFFDLNTSYCATRATLSIVIINALGVYCMYI